MTLLLSIGYIMEDIRATHLPPLTAHYRHLTTIGRNVALDMTQNSSEQDEGEGNRAKMSTKLHLPNMLAP